MVDLVVCIECQITKILPAAGGFMSLSECATYHGTWTDVGLMIFAFQRGYVFIDVG